MMPNTSVSPAASKNSKRPKCSPFKSCSTTTSMDPKSLTLLEHDLFGKPLHTFPDHALKKQRQREGTAAYCCWAHHLTQDEAAEDHAPGKPDPTSSGTCRGSGPGRP